MRSRPVIFAVADRVNHEIHEIHEISTTEETRHRHVSTGGDLFYRHGAKIGLFPILFSGESYHINSTMSRIIIIFVYHRDHGGHGGGEKVTGTSVDVGLLGVE